MRIATFNVNSLAKRQEALLGFLDERKVDLALLQELKCPPERFPLKALEQAGWHAAFVSEKAYNGVAVLSRDPAMSVRRSSLPPLQEKNEEKDQEKVGQEKDKEQEDTQADRQDDTQADTQARYVEVSTHGLVIASLYAPNGNPLDISSDNPVGSEKFRYKLAWMDRLCHHVEERLLPEGRPFLLGGDFNVCPQPLDVFDEQAMEGDALLHEKSRRRYRRLLYSGLVDAFRAANNPQHKEKGYTYWDYRRARFTRDEGLRIDMLLLSPALSEKIETCFVARSLREQEQPSDHTPLCLDLALLDLSLPDLALPDLAWTSPALEAKPPPPSPSPPSSPSLSSSLSSLPRSSSAKALQSKLEM